MKLPKIAGHPPTRPSKDQLQRFALPLICLLVDMTLSGVTRSADAEMSAMLAAESLSIEPFERSRWRVRWTRSGQLCPFNRWESWTEGRAVTDVGPITTATRSRAAAARAAGVSNSQLRIHLRRRRVRARHIEAGEVRARFTRCHV
jgi:hypothetical protein